MSIDEHPLVIMARAATSCRRVLYESTAANKPEHYDPIVSVLRLLKEQVERDLTEFEAKRDYYAKPESER